jgi:hypothetical protein
MVHDPGYDLNHTRQHSTVTINGKDQIKGKSGEYLRFGSGDSFHYFATDLSAAYDKTYLNQFIRHVIMVKDSYIVLFDEVDLKKPADITCHLQTRAPAKVYNQKDALINGSANKLYVLNAASEQTQTSIEGWKEKNEELNAIRTKIPGAQSDNLIVTVLLPADQKEEGQEEVPKASFEKGQLTIKDGDGNKDLIIFTEGQHRWHLKSVNGEDAGHISSGDERTLEPFRKNPDNNIPVNRLPSWFFPDKQIMN